MNFCSPSKTRGLSFAFSTRAAFLSHLRCAAHSRSSFGIYRALNTYTTYTSHLTPPKNLCKSWYYHRKPIVPTSTGASVSRLKPSSRLFSSTAFMDRNGDTRPKRKQSPVPTYERPAKHLKPEAVAPTPGDTTPNNGTVFDVENDADAGRVVNLTAAPADSPEWQATIERVVKSVVSIHFCQTCSFDTDLSLSSQATGFVVDSEKGYILTNRHVACSGPFWGYCIFDNHEEVSSLLCDIPETSLNYIVRCHPRLSRPGS